MDSSHPCQNVSNRAVEVLCVYGSPRIRGNTDRLMNAFAAGVEAVGATADRVYLRDLRVSPCREIYACERKGRCALEDDMQPLYERLRDVDAVALSSPVMFYGVSAHAKAFIDRCQALWCLRYRREERVSRSALVVRRGVLLAAGGSKGRKLFDGLRLTFKYFLDTLEAEPWRDLLVRSVDERGDIDAHPTALAEAENLGRALVARVRADLAEAEEAGGG